jgi:glycosyltransferase involved in cell wall biosynthesis
VNPMTRYLSRRKYRHQSGAQRCGKYEDVDLAIVAESTYPYLRGGVSAVIHDIVQANPDRSVGIIHIAWDSSCPTEVAYPLPPNVRWVYPVFLSMNEHVRDFKQLPVSALGLPPSQRRLLAEQVFAALDAVVAGDCEPLWALYDQSMNPRTRRYSLWPLLATQEFMSLATQRFADIDVPFTSLFWLLREFFSLACAICGPDFPSADVYHSHTTGYAGLLAAVAARQNGGRVLLTEHNLYTRDTINCLLDRNMNTVVSARDWQVDTEVAPEQRCWMAWYTEIGRLTYKAADYITYLYPTAIGEAAGLGSTVEKASIVPNGMLLDKFESARAMFTARQEAIAAKGGERQWRLAYCARLVPIKGLLDLISSVAELVGSGTVNFTLDVMGHADEIPAYAAQCYDRVRDLGLGDYVRFLGNRNMAEVLGDFDMLVLPSYNEGQPMVVLEAMAVGLPIIGTPVGGMEQLIVSPLADANGPGAGPSPVPSPGPCGVLVPPGNVSALAEALTAVMSDQELYDIFSANSRSRVSQYFELDKAMGAYRRIYSQLEGVSRLADVPAPRPSAAYWRRLPRLGVAQAASSADESTSAA